MLSPRLTLTQMRALAAREERALSNALLRALLRIQDDIPLTALEVALVRRDLDAATAILGFDRIQDALAQVAPAMVPVRNAAWDSALLGIPQVILAEPGVTLSWDAWAAQNPDKAAAFARRRLEEIVGITNASREAIRETLRRGLQQGTPIQALAREIRDVVGLTLRQATALARFRADLVREERPADQVERMVARRARGMLRDRSEGIARTEILGTLNDAKRLQWERLVAEGSLDPRQWERIWKTADDERVDCVICAPFDERVAVIGGQFTPNPALVKPGTPSQHPGPIAHPLCRCIEVIGARGLRAFRLARGGSARRRVRDARVG